MRVRSAKWMVGGLVAATVGLTACPEPVTQNTAGPGAQNAGPGGQPGQAPGQNAAGPAPDGAAPPDNANAAPGEAGKPPPPGFGVLNLSEIFPNTASQEKVEKSGSFVTLKGTISGDECKGKQIRVDAVQQGEGVNSLVTFLRLETIGEFSFKVPKSDKPTYVLAACDVTGDGMVDPTTDMLAAYAKNPVTPSADSAGIDMKLALGLFTTGGPPEPKGERIVPITEGGPTPKDANKQVASPGVSPPEGGTVPAAAPGGAAPGGTAPGGAPPAGAPPAGAAPGGAAPAAAGPANPAPPTGAPAQKPTGTK